MQFLVVTAIFVSLAGLGLARLDRHNSRQLESASIPLDVVLHEKPEWMAPALADEIVNGVAEPILVQAQAGVFDNHAPSVPQVMVQAFTGNGWVKRVVWARRLSGGRIELNCEFREPVAVVTTGRTRRLVDATGFILPGEYQAGELDECGFIEIRGCAGSPPTTSRLWTSADFQDALKLVKILRTMVFADQIKAVDFSNHNGRLHRQSCWIVLITDRGSVIRWGRPPGREDGLEVTVSQKLALLAGVYRDHGHIDYGLPWIGVRWSATEIEAAVASADGGSE